MAIYRIYPQKDAWITDKRLNEFTTTRASGSNLGSDPSLNLFARKGSISSGSVELARTLIKFPISDLSSSMFTTLDVPSGSVTYKLRMYDMIHDESTPSSYAINVHPLTKGWDEGTGIDSNKFTDAGAASWIMSDENTDWTITGSDFSTMSASQPFSDGSGDLDIDITQIVNEWLTGSTADNGLVVKLANTDEDNGVSKYRKAFHGRETLYVDRLPYIEARWDSSVKDNRHNFEFDANNTLILYNYVRGEPTTLSAPVTLTVKDVASGSAGYSKTFSAAETSAGIFTASVYIDSSGSYSGSIFYDTWDANGITKVTSSFTPLIITGSTQGPDKQYTVNLSNLKRVYYEDEEARISVTVRDRDYVTHIGAISTASADIESECIEKCYWSICNDETGFDVIPFGTGSDKHTKTSYSKSGNYFDFKFKYLVPGFKYRVKLLLDVNNEKQIIDDGFTFKVK